LGRRWNMRLGPHTIDQIRSRDGWASTYVYEEELRMFPMSKKRRHSLVSVDFKLVDATNIARSIATKA
uniref:Uncharacterized protein n=1 Tax=Acrobeloides nanus TaxID=290746 RepID=A0A914D3B4_9BILA